MNSSYNQRFISPCSDTSGKVTGSGPLHLDHIGTLFGHQLGAIRSGHMLGEVQNLYRKGLGQA